MLADVIALVLVLQALQNLSDGEVMDEPRCDLRWKVACGLPIDHAGPHVRQIFDGGRLVAECGRPPAGVVRSSGVGWS